MKPALFPPLCAAALFSGTVLAAEPFVPNLGPDLPTITVTCGEVSLMLRRASQWTPGRIDFRSKPMTTERSAYGTVFSFPGVGFIGTGHLENEPEPLVSLGFFLDGRELTHPEAELRGEQFRFVRRSRVRDFELRGEFEIKDNRLLETTTVRTGKEVPLKLVYHFMHAWVPTVDAFLAGSDDGADAVSAGAAAAVTGKGLAGTFPDTEEAARKFHVVRRVDWVAVYEPVSAQFAVSRLLAAPAAADNLSMIWNVPGTYRKYYLKCFEGETVPAGFEGTWRMVTGFGAAPPENWEAAARTLAAELGSTE